MSHVSLDGKTYFVLFVLSSWEYEMLVYQLPNIPDWIAIESLC